MQVKPGYKQTEVGIVPQDWSVTQLGQLADFVTSGSRGWAQFYSQSGALFIRSQNVRDGRLCFDDVQCVTPPTGAEGNRTKVERYDLLITITGNSVGNVALIEKSYGEAYISQHVGLIRLREPSTAAFINRYLSPNSPGNLQIVGSQSGQSKPGLNLQNLRDFRIALPPTVQEVHAILETFCDVDALLRGLDQLIAKKRDLKQAAMQQLLSGKTRLPGFSGQWEVKRLGDLGTTYGGLTGKTKADFGAGEARYITFMNIMTNVVINCGTFERVKILPTETQNRVMKGDLFFNGSSETPEEVAMCSVLLEEANDVYLNSFCFGFRFREGAEADGVFFAHYLRSREGRELMKSLAQGSTRYNLSKVALLNSSLRLPARLEQTAIAAVLSDMDAELSALVAQRDKTRVLKQAMMQELLSGKTRLVSPEVTHA